MCSAFLNDTDNREIRLNVLMGRLEPEDFAFMPIEDLNLQKMIELRIECKEKERSLKNKQLLPGSQREGG